MDSLVSQIQNANANGSSEKSIKTTYDDVTSKDSKSLCVYLKDHIMEELEGAKDYMTKAIEMKEKHPAWGKTFYKMAEMEVEHANCMNKIFASMGDMEFPCDDSMYKSILEAYTKYMSEISAMKQIYHS